MSHAFDKDQFVLFPDEKGRILLTQEDAAALVAFAKGPCNHGVRDVDVPNNRTICRGCGKVEPLRTPADDEKLYLVYLADDLIREFVRPGRIITEEFENSYKSWIAGLRTLDAAWGLLANCWTGNWDAFAPPDWIDRARAWEKRWRAMPLKQAQMDVTQQKIDERVRQEVQHAQDVMQQKIDHLESLLVAIGRVAKNGL